MVGACIKHFFLFQSALAKCNGVTKDCQMHSSLDLLLMVQHHSREVTIAEEKKQAISDEKKQALKRNDGNVHDQCNWKCYLATYPDLSSPSVCGADTACAEKHFLELGRSERRDCTCKANLLSRKPRVTLLVPGVGSLDHAKDLHSTLATLMNSTDVHLKCIMHNYLPDLQDVLVDILYPCKVELNEGFHFFQHIRAPLKYETDYVVIWHGSAAASQDFSISTFLRVMTSNSVGVLAPAVKFLCNGNPLQLDGTNNTLKTSGTATDVDMHRDQWFMSPSEVSINKSGRFTDFVEFQVDFLKWDAFRCLQHLGNKYSARSGWGIDYVFPTFCNVSVGVYDAMPVAKEVTQRCGKEPAYDHNAAYDEMQNILAWFSQEHPDWVKPEGKTVEYILGPSAQ